MPSMAFQLLLVLLLARNSLQFCDILSGKRLLFSGPNHIYQLHLQLISPQFSCLGPDHCTFHHICTDEVNTARFKKTPVHLDNSSLVRYARSDTLALAAPSEPVIDIDTDIRVHESNWTFLARRVDILVLGRAPIPSPAWTYTNPEEWRDTNDAAIHITHHKFMPEIERTLDAIRGDKVLGKIKTLWYSAPYMNASNDPWTMYHNTQIFLHTQFIPPLLARYNITYVPHGTLDAFLAALKTAL